MVGEREEIYVSIPDSEIEDNSDLLNLNDTMDLSEVIINEWFFRKNKIYFIK